MQSKQLVNISDHVLYANTQVDNNMLIRWIIDALQNPAPAHPIEQLFEIFNHPDFKKQMKLDKPQEVDQTNTEYQRKLFIFNIVASTELTFELKLELIKRIIAWEVGRATKFDDIFRGNILTTLLFKEFLKIEAEYIVRCITQHQAEFLPDIPEISVAADYIARIKTLEDQWQEKQKQKGDKKYPPAEKEMLLQSFGQNVLALMNILQYAVQLAFLTKYSFSLIYQQYMYKFPQTNPKIAEQQICQLFRLRFVELALLNFINEKCHSESIEKNDQGKYLKYFVTRLEFMLADSEFCNDVINSLLTSKDPQREAASKLQLVKLNAANPLLKDLTPPVPPLHTKPPHIIARPRVPDSARSSSSASESAPLVSAGSNAGYGSGGQPPQPLTMPSEKPSLFQQLFFWLIHFPGQLVGSPLSTLLLIGEMSSRREMPFQANGPLACSSSIFCCWEREHAAIAPASEQRTNLAVQSNLLSK